MMRNNKGRANICVVLFSCCFIASSHAEFSLNFQSNPNTVASVANVSCNAGGGTMMGGMMGNVGPGCGSDRFLQEVVDDNGTLYYHVIVGDTAQDPFAMEFYIRNGGCCWNSGGMMGGMMGGSGSAPYSSSYGDTGNPLASAYTPLAAPSISGTGTGNPGRVYMRQINNDIEMSQSFEKPFEALKPRIVQTTNSGDIQQNFIVDMTNGNYNSFSTPSRFEITQQLNQPLGEGNFSSATDIGAATVTAGQFSYSGGSGHGQSYGNYNYSSDAFDVYSVNWIDFCDPAQNPDHNCNFSTSGGGGGMMGM